MSFSLSHVRRLGECLVHHFGISFALSLVFFTIVVVVVIPTNSIKYFIKKFSCGYFVPIILPSCLSHRFLSISTFSSRLIDLWWTQLWNSSSQPNEQAIVVFIRLPIRKLAQPIDRSILPYQADFYSSFLHSTLVHTLRFHFHSSVSSPSLQLQRLKNIFCSFLQYFFRFLYNYWICIKFKISVSIYKIRCK